MDGPTSLPLWRGTRPEILTDDELIEWARSLGPEAGVEVHRRAIEMMHTRFESTFEPTAEDWRLWETVCAAERHEPVDWSEWTAEDGRHLTATATWAIFDMADYVHGP